MKVLKISLFGIGLLVLMVTLIFGRRDIPLEDLKAKYGQDPSAFIAVHGMDVHYRDEGDPDDSLPIVLIHGTGSSLHTFNDWTDQLILDHRVIRMDLPAYGLTGPFPDRDYSMDQYADFIHAFLTALDIDSCIVGGNSLGGGIAWQFTVKYPKMVDKLILIDAMGYPSSAKSVPLAFRIATIPVIKNVFTFITPRFVAKGSVLNVYADKTKVTDELVDRYFELTLREGNRQAFVDRLGVTHDPEAHENIKSIRQPTLVLWGEQDQLIPVAHAERFHQDLGNDTLVVLENVGHIPMEESPSRSLEAVKAFLKDSQ